MVNPRERSPIALAVEGSEFIGVSLSELHESTMHPRKFHDLEAHSGLVGSIKRHGVMTPLIVRRANNGYEILSGSRRYRAAKESGIRSVPCRVVDINDDEAVEIMIAENIQRSDIDPFHEALALKSLLDLSDGNLEEVALKIGKSPFYVSSMISFFLNQGNCRSD